ncbi:hypothetical protein MTQ10_04785 [Streptomyces sp. XM83C]|uniref:Uncharacterized protein n=1 Tax=Streptomyces thermocoprophilus TaxID=78356 RepID=A0ABV5VHP9_9ACTN|nr:hypothetical protein [Streptomyces sp. XM83C]MCK1818938.1 hypothetical protein [Streptomyces sp. XM83C]
MGIEQHLVIAGRLCSRGLPAEDGGPDGMSGPGHRTAELASSHGLNTTDALTRARWQKRLHEDAEALAALLSARWGEPYHLGLQTTLLRTESEEIPQPWARLSHLAAHAWLWECREHGHWLVLAVADRDPADEIRLLLTATETDPP